MARYTLITATFNSAKTIEDTLLSVLQQTLQDVEYIVVDGGSTDETMDIVRAYEPKFQGRLRWLSEPDNGLYDAMNKGIAMATGEIVGILNSDDFFASPTVLQSVSDAFNDEQVDAVYGEIFYVCEGSKLRIVNYAAMCHFQPWMMRFGFAPSHPAFYVRRRCYERFGHFDTRYHIAADFDLMLRMIYLGRIRLRYLPQYLVTMRPGGLSTFSVSNRCKSLRETALACRRNGLRSYSFLVVIKYIYKKLGRRLPCPATLWRPQRNASSSHC